MTDHTCPECETVWDSLSAAGECATIDRVQARNARRRGTTRAMGTLIACADSPSLP